MIELDPVVEAQLPLSVREIRSFRRLLQEDLERGENGIGRQTSEHRI